MINRSTKIITNISIEEIIYNQSIELRISVAKISITIVMFFFQNQLQQMIDRALNNYVQRHFFQSESVESSDFSELSEQQNQDDENIVDNTK